MSEISEQTWMCERCGRVQEGRVYESINVTLEPELLGRVLSGDLFTLGCRFCGRVMPVKYDTLYHDMERRVMIWLIHGDGEAGGLEPRVVEAYPYVRRVVRSVEELAEKVRVLNAGLDDRVVELFKLRRLRKEPALVGAAGVWFGAVDGEELVFAVRELDGTPRGVTVGREEFEKFAAGLGEAPAMDEREWVRVDEGWARGDEC